MKASAIAPSNIALVKYWGKRSKELMLPNNASISMSLSDFHAHTTVEFSPEYENDILIIDGKEFDHGEEEYEDYVGRFLNFVRNKYGVKEKVKIVSENNFPMAAGLASSAAGFGVLATAVNEALKLGLSKKELSILARIGSGSATRSILGGFVEWKRGVRDDGRDSFGVQIADENYWPEFRMICCITSKKEKKIKSRAGMKQTLATSPMYQGWLESLNEDIMKVREGIQARDFSKVGRTAEENCLKMHATMFTTKPAIIYPNPGTMKIIHEVEDMRDNGIECYFTMDAGPQVKIMCLEKDVDKIKARVQDFPEIEEMKVEKPGQGARVVEEHLF